MSAIPARVPTGTCVGRDQELDHLGQRFEEACREGERLVLIRGPSGVGKTRLMSEFRSRMRLEGAVVLEGRCTSGGRALAPLGEILRGAVRFLEEVGHADEVSLAPLAFLLGEQPPEEVPDGGMTRLEQRVRFFEAYCSLLRQLSRIKPPVILVHDLDRADSATVELVTHLLDGAGPWLDSPSGDRTLLGLVVASVRCGQEQPAVERLAAHPKGAVLDLAGFDGDAVRQFLQEPAVIERVLDVTGGNPAELQALLDAPAGGADSLLRHSVEEMGPDARRLLAALSVLGRPTEASTVIRVAGVTAAARALAELIDSGLAIKSVRDGEVLLRTVRYRVAELTYEWLPEEERRELHRRAAELLSGATGLAAQDLASHAIRAGDRDLAVPAALDAAYALELTYAYEAATGLLEEAHELASASQRRTISERLAELFTHTGEYRRALDHANHVLTARPGDPAARLAVGRLQSLSGDYEGAASTLDALSEDTAGVAEDELAAAVAAARAEVRFWRGEYDEARSICCDQQGGSPTATLALENMLGKIELTCGDHGAARGIFEDNLDEAREAGLEREQAHALINLGIVRLRQHDHDSATRYLGEALEVARRIGALRESAIALENLAVLAHFRRDYGAALRSYHSAVADLKRLGNRALLARAANNLGELYLRLGDPSRAARMCNFAEQMAGDEPPRSIVAEGQLLRARVALTEGNTAVAEGCLKTSIALFNAVGERSRVSEALLLLGQCHLRQGDVSAARSRLAALREAGGLDQSRQAEAAMLESDIEAATFGDPLRLALVAVDRFEEAGDPEGAWRAHLRAAMLLLEGGDAERHRRHLERATVLEAEVSATVPRGFEEGLARDPDRIRLAKALADRDRLDRHHAQRAAPSAAPSYPRELAPTPSPRRAAKSTSHPAIVHRSAAMAQVLEVVERAATTDGLVLVRGESGTGKELIADALHRLSPRSGRPFVKVNCGALVESLLISELFGHEKGAFTGAMQRRKGRFEAADGGTLFLDEIGDISPATQVSLLRVLQEQLFERVGGSKPIRTDVRIICATNRDLEALVREGRFREDLYYRLKSIQVFVPPLRDRPDDISILATHFLDKEATERSDGARRLDGMALRRLQRHDWPGNVRELENVMRTVSIFVDGPVITATHLEEFAELDRLAPPPRLAEDLPAVPADAGAAATVEVLPLPEDPMDGVLGEVLDGDTTLAAMKKLVEQQCIEAALERTGGNITRAAELLGMKRPRLSQLVKEYGLSRHNEIKKVTS